MEMDRNATDRLSGSPDSGLTELTELLSEGDTELWYAEGRDASWSFPLWVKWGRAKDGKLYALIEPALVPYSKQGLYLKALFESHNLIERDNLWMVKAEVVPALLKKAPGVTPRFYYKWESDDHRKAPPPGPIPPMKVRHNARQPWQGKRFGGDKEYVSLIAEAAGVSTSVVKVVLDGLSRAAVEILVDRRGVLDLGFVKLVALPYRANWKEIAAFKLRKSKKTEVLREGTREALAEAEIPEMLCSPHNIGMRRRSESELGHLDYTVEAIPMKSFETALRKRESQKTASGRTAYVRFFETTVEKLYDEILEILQTYLKKTHYPFAKVCESGSSGSLRFVASVGASKAFGVNLRGIPVHIVAGRTGFSATAGEGQFRLVSAAAAEVQEVPAVLPAATQLRQCAERGAVEELGDRERGDGGLPLPNVTEGATAGQPVLPRVEAGGESSGLDGKGNQ